MNIEDDRILSKDLGKKKIIQELTKEMKALQDDMNVLYMQYQKVQEDMVNNQRYINVLNNISAITGLIQHGIDLSVCKVDEKDNFLMKISESKEYTKSKLTALGKLNSTLKTKVLSGLTKLGTLQGKLSIEYHEEYIPLPDVVPNPLVLTSVGDD